MTVEWAEVRDRLLDLGARVKQRRAVDIVIKELLKTIPVVGGFVSAYWDQLEAPGEKDATEVAMFLEHMADNRALFERAERRLEAVGYGVLQLHEPLQHIVADLEHIRDDTGYIREVLQRIEQAVEEEPARRGLAFGLAMTEDRERAARTVEEINRAFTESGEAPTPARYYMEGMAAAGRYDYPRAEACLLEALKDPSLTGVAHRGLAISYQRWANERINEDNYGSAEQLLGRAEKHGKEAATYDLLDVLTLNQLGYTCKDLGIRYQATHKITKANHYFDEALRYFTDVLKRDADDASAHNGVASVCLMRGDYDCAAKEAEAALTHKPDYREALFDLAQAYFGKVKQDPADSVALRRGLETCVSLIQREQDDPRLPQHAVQRLLSMCDFLTSISHRRTSGYAHAVADAESAPATVEEVGQFVFSGAASRELIDRLAPSLQSYADYLQELGLTFQASLGIYIDPDTSPEHALRAYPDPASHRLVVGQGLTEHPDVVLHEYTHYLLASLSSQERASWAAAARSIEAGLAYYLPCSQREDPVHASMYDLRWNPLPAPEWLDGDHQAGLRWAGALWDLRSDLGREAIDRNTVAAWRSVSNALPELAVKEFIEALKPSLGAPDVVERVLKERGVPL